jgi:predicted secreted protein
MVRKPRWECKQPDTGARPAGALEPARPTRERMTDEQIAEAIQRNHLEVAYLRELAAALGFADEEGWTEEVFAAIERATPEQRRRAALRTLALAES